MQVIPVIDLKKGLAVAAKLGKRELYRPLQSSLCESAEPAEVVKALRTIYSFKVFYLADLDAIEQMGDQNDLIEFLVTQFPEVVFWVDNGTTFSALARQPSNLRFVPVIGTESQQQPAERLASDDYVLSLDFRAEVKLGHPALFDDNGWWPQRIILMALTRIGNTSGPDFMLLGNYCRRYPHKHLIAAGGVRHVQDLQVLQTMGIQSVLVSTALHAGRLTQRELEALQKNTPKPGYFAV